MVDVLDLFARMESHALSLGIFDRVNRHEATGAPGKGYTASIWVDQLSPIRSSGLNSTSTRVTFFVRTYTPIFQEPLDMIEPDMLQNANLLMAAYSGDFTLGGTIREVDLLGETGAGLEMRAGYVTIDSTLHRVYTVTVPVIVNDLFSQEV